MLERYLSHRQIIARKSLRSSFKKMLRTDLNDNKDCLGIILKLLQAFSRYNHTFYWSNGNCLCSNEFSY